MKTHLTINRVVLVNKINKMLFENDPMGLVSSDGGVTDEYLDVAEKLADKLKTYTNYPDRLLKFRAIEQESANKDILLTIVVGVFCDCFGSRLVAKMADIETTCNDLYDIMMDKNENN